METKLKLTKQEGERKMKTYRQLNSRCSRGFLTVGLFIIGLMVWLAIGVSTAQAQMNTKMYNVKNMGILEGMKACEPAAMNNLGQVIGTATAGDVHAAFLYYYDQTKEGEMEDVGGLGTRAFGINPAGIIVGDAYVPGQLKTMSHAALFNGGGVVDLGVLKDQTFSRANGMNSMRQVVGYSGRKRDNAQSRAFIWTSRTGMMDVGTLGGPYAQAYAINDAGWVTGTSQMIDTIKTGATHAFIYQPLSQTDQYMEPMRDLGTLGGSFSYGMALNANRHVVGYSTINNADGRVHAFFYSGLKMVDLGSLDQQGFANSAALAVNNADQVVGVSYMATTEKTPLNRVAFIWDRNLAGGVGHMTNLNDLVASEGKGFWILSAVGITDSGQIAASAWDYANGTVCAVLLTPAN
jgi:probable HAF family extracellular repeat protein